MHNVSVPELLNPTAPGDTITITAQIVTRGIGNNKTIQSTPTGGSVSTSGDYRIHTFTSGTLTAPSGWSSSYDYVVVAGGGSGGNNKVVMKNGGVVDSGGMLWFINSICWKLQYTIGSGGATLLVMDKSEGGNTTFGLTAIGGGGGRTRDTSLANCNGGSGGGTNELG